MTKKSKIWSFLKRDIADAYLSLFRDPLHGLILLTILSPLAIWHFWNGQQEWIEEYGEKSSMKERNIWITVSGCCILLFTTISEISRRTIKRRKRKNYFERIKREGIESITSKQNNVSN